MYITGLGWTIESFYVRIPFGKAVEPMKKPALGFTLSTAANLVSPRALAAPPDVPRLPGEDFRVRVLG